jgi:hypothetical protein
MAFSFFTVMKQILTVAVLALFCQGAQFIASCDASTADHLVPLEKRYGLLLKYERLSREKLLVTPGELARFISLPGSASVETSVSIYQMRGKRGSLPGDYWVTVTQSSKSLWETMQTVSKPKAVRVERLDAPLPQVVAQTVHDTWVRMLTRVRPALRSEEEALVDSTQEIFAISKSDGSIIEGQTSSRPGRKTKALIEMAFSLMEYCDKPPALRNRIVKDIQRHAIKVTKQ